MEGDALGGNPGATGRREKGEELWGVVLGDPQLARPFPQLARPFPHPH